MSGQGSRSPGFAKVYVETFGCEMNVAESRGIEALFLDAGVELADSADDADLIVVNTCAVRHSAETRAEGRLSRIKKVKAQTGAKVIFTGCMASRDEFRTREDFGFIDLFVENSRKTEIPGLALRLFSSSPSVRRDECGYSFLRRHFVCGDADCYVPIQNGCDNFCSYCVVPYTRGRETSRDFGEVLEEVRAADAAGARTITLVGQNVNSYGFGGRGFSDLVEAVDSVGFANVRRVYFDSPHPKDFDDRLIDVLGGSSSFARHFHIPVQSASTRILRLMNRRSTADDIYSVFRRMKERMPDCSFSTDLMVGFPTETESEFEETLSFAREVRFTDAFMYYYNPRKGTLAFDRFADMDEDVKKDRLARLIAVQRGISSEIRAAKVGTVETVICRRASRRGDGMLADTASKEAVLLRGGDYAPGSVVRARFTALAGQALVAREAECGA